MGIIGFASIPSCEEGRPRRSSKCYATLDSARPGRSDTCLHEVFDLPRRADFLR